jgi:intracellular sulfur oxidation DsrE/DsrF family protein
MFFEQTALEDAAVPTCRRRQTVQPYTHAHQVHGIGNATALATAFAVCLGLGFPLSAHAAPDAVQAASAAGKMSQQQKLVIQVSDGDPKKWNLALNNAKNVQDAFGKDKVEIELVVYGPGIDMLKLESAVGNRVSEAVAGGVKVVACENTMAAQKLTKADMLKGIGYVPAGVVELMQKQQQGYAYIRP